MARVAVTMDHFWCSMLGTGETPGILLSPRSQAGEWMGASSGTRNKEQQEPPVSTLLIMSGKLGQ